MNEPGAPSPDIDETAVLVGLFARERWGCLATVDADGVPLAAMVAFVPDGERGDLLLHLSTLARHARNALARPRVSLAVSEPYAGQPDPQTLARVSVQGDIEPIAREHADFSRLRACYVAALPASEPRFAFTDFHLLRLVVGRARYVGGFARAFTIGEQRLRAAVRAAATR